MAEWTVAVAEEHVFHVTVDAADYASALRAARAAREDGKGKRVSKKPRRTFPWAGRTGR